MYPKISLKQEKYHRMNVKVHGNPTVGVFEENDKI